VMFIMRITERDTYNSNLFTHRKNASQSRQKCLQSVTVSLGWGHRVTSSVVSVARWANTLAEPHYLMGLTG